MKKSTFSYWVVSALLLGTQPAAAQQSYTPVVNAGERVLEFDWPAIRVGTAEYEEGPTGTTVIHFPSRATVAVDVRGGGPSSVNSDYIRLGYDLAELDAVVFSGGSWYGLEGVTAVSSALKDDGLRDGNAFGDPPNIALSTGSIIFDFGGRRLNEIYPDRELAQAAFRAAVPGRFPLGAQGAGRFAVSGGYFGCNAYSGQGAAFRQIGPLKIAVFTVVNAYGAVIDRSGRVQHCYEGDGRSTQPAISDLIARHAETRDAAWTAQNVSPRNTTISLVVVNQRLSPASLQRVAIQVHTAMARSIYPFATLYDGDVLYAASTQEWDPGERTDDVVDIGVAASELMWDAVLAAAPAQPEAPAASSAQTIDPGARRFVGEYEFSERVRLRITVRDGRLFAQASGERNVYAIGRDNAVELRLVSPATFTIPGRYPLALRFESGGRLVINPGHWQQIGRKR